MAIQGKLEADFASFQAAVDAAVGKLKSFESGSAKVETALTKMGNSFSGQKIISDATFMAKAIEQAGGASTLTSKEMAKVNATVTEAIAKYKALGGSAPQSMVALADATKQTAQHVGVLDGAVAKMVAALSVATLIKKAASTLMDMGAQAFATAGTLVDLSNKTGLSTETLQKMQFVAKQSGSDMTVFADAAFKMGVNVSEGTAKAHKGSDILGLSWKDLRAASPDEQFNMVVQALEAMEDPQKRNEAAVALFGKTAKEILPAIVDGYSKVAKEATVAGNAQVLAVDAAGDAWDRFKTKTGTVFVNAVGSVILLREAMATLTKEQRDFVQQTLPATATTDDFSAALIKSAEAKKKAHDVPLLPQTGKAELDSFVTSLGAAESGYKKLTTAQLADLNAALQLGKSNDDIINKLNITEEVLTVGKKAFEDHRSAVSKSGDELKKNAAIWKDYNSVAGGVIKQLSGDTIEGLKWDLARGKSQSNLAAVYMVTAEQVGAVADLLKDETAAAKLAVTTTEALAAAEAKHSTELRKLLDARGVDLLKLESDNYASRLTAQTEYDDAIAKRTLSIYDYQKQAILKHLADQKLALETKGGNWKAAFDLDTKVANEAIDAIEWKKIQDNIDETDAATAEWASHSKNNFEFIGATIKTNLVDALNGIPDILSNAFTGGGGILGALKAIGVQIAEAIAKPLIASLTSGITKALKNLGSDGASSGAAIAGGMSAATTATLAFTGAGIYASYLLQKSTAEAGNMQAQWDGLSGTILKVATAEQVAAAKGDQWALFQSVLSDAYQATGQTVQQLQKDFTDLLAARTEGPDATAEAIKNLMGPLQEWKDNVVAIAEAQDIVTGKISEFSGVIADVGIGIPDFLQPMLDDLMEAPGLTDDLKAAISGLRDSATPDFAKLEQLAKSYGGEIKDLGPTFQQAHTIADTAKWISDFEKLKAAGADMNGVLGFMADEASAVVQESIKFGTAIPENMKGMLASLAAAGQLLDENKQQITDISGLKFGAAVKTDVDKLKDAITLLAEAIDKIPGKIGVIAGSKIPPIHVPIIYDDPGFTPSQTADFAATGGLVTATGIQHFAGGGNVLPFIPRGSDTVPAMLTPGELVLTPAQQAKMLGAGGASAAAIQSLLDAVRGMRGDMKETRRDQERSIALAFAKALMMNRRAS